MPKSSERRPEVDATHLHDRPVAQTDEVRQAPPRVTAAVGGVMVTPQPDGTTDTAAELDSDSTTHGHPNAARPRPDRDRRTP